MIVLLVLSLLSYVVVFVVIKDFLSSFSKPFNKDVLCHYVDMFNLTGMHLVDALR